MLFENKRWTDINPSAHFLSMSVIHSICGLTMLLAFCFLSQARFILVTMSSSSILVTTIFELISHIVFLLMILPWLNKNLTLSQLLILMIQLVRILLDHSVSSSFHFGPAYLKLDQPWGRFLRLQTLQLQKYVIYKVLKNCDAQHQLLHRSKHLRLPPL